MVFEVDSMIDTCLAQLVYLNAKEGGQGMAGSRPNHLATLKQPLPIAIQLYHIGSALLMLCIEMLPTTTCNTHILSQYR